MAEAEEPGYACDEPKAGFVRVKAKMDSMKVKSAGISSFLSKHPHPKAKNADIDKPEFGPRTFSIRVVGHKDGTMKGAVYELMIKQLPHNIVPEDSYISAEDGWVYVWLKKEDDTQSWESAIRDGRLETAE